MKIIGVEEHFLSSAVRASWAAAASAGQDPSFSNFSVLRNHPN